MRELVFGVGVMLFVGGGFRAIIAAVAVRDRRRTGEHDPAQAERAFAIYGIATLAGGAILIASLLI